MSALSRWKGSGLASRLPATVSGGKRIGRCKHIWYQLTSKSSRLLLIGTVAIAAPEGAKAVVTGI
jgi:hypothetical protein